MPPPVEEFPLRALSWAGYLQFFTGRVEEAKRVVKAGGLQDPTIAEHLRASRLHAAQVSGRSTT
jgi:hypothetical protein